MSTELFQVATSLFTLTWSSKRDISRTEHEALWSSPAGHLSIRPVRAGVEVPTVTRNVPASSRLDEDAAAVASAGPRLEEETEYLVYARARVNGAALEVRHADPAIASQLRHEHDGVVHGAVNFRSNVGFSEFEVLIDGRSVCAFIVEVFPTKLDYRSDYESLLAEVQGISTSLALEYLRSTYRMGRAAGSKPTDDLQWVLLLQDLFDDLETAVRHIASRPDAQLCDGNLYDQSTASDEPTPALDVPSASARGPGTSWISATVSKRVRASGRDPQKRHSTHRSIAGSRTSLV